MTYGLREITKDVIKGKLQLSTSELATERIKVCEKCPEFKRMLRQCAVCGCLMEAKVKVLYSECPIGKW